MSASSVTVLSYHRIANPGGSDLSDSLIDVSPAAFEAQMSFVASRYNVISSRDLVRALTSGYTLPSRALVITFDDGYRCFLDTAMPVLRRLGLPVTLFVSTHMAGQEGALFWWDALHRALMGTDLAQIDVPSVGVLPLGGVGERGAAYRCLVAHLERLAEEEASTLLGSIVDRSGVAPNCNRYLLDWEELQALEAEGVAIGPHTRHHPILAQATPERVRAEVSGSWRDLRSRLKQPVPLFCYPNGRPHALNSTTLEAVRGAGLVGAFTTMPGLNVVGKTDPYRMLRIGASYGESLRHFSIKISPLGRVYRVLKTLLRRDAGLEPAVNGR